MGGRIKSGDEVGHWVADKLRTVYSPESSAAIGLVKDDKIVAGVIYENWNRRSVVTHIAIEGRLTRSFLYAIFHYPFVTCGVNKIISAVNDTNTKIQKKDNKTIVFLDIIGILFFICTVILYL